MRKKARIGNIKITRESFEDSPAELARVFGMLGFLPVRIDCPEFNMLTYIGISPAFREVPEGDTIPKYTLTLYSSQGVITGCQVEEIT